jgi:hypothetical protein
MTSTMDDEPSAEPCQLHVVLPPLVGRDRELALLRDGLTAARAGRGGLVLIGGGAGIGKIALADRLARDATDARVTVLTALAAVA